MRIRRHREDPHQEQRRGQRRERGVGLRAPIDRGRHGRVARRRHRGQKPGVLAERDARTRAFAEGPRVRRAERLRQPACDQVRERERRTVERDLAAHLGREHQLVLVARRAHQRKAHAAVRRDQPARDVEARGRALREPALQPVRQRTGAEREPEERDRIERDRHAAVVLKVRVDEGEQRHRRRAGAYSQLDPGARADPPAARIAEVTHLGHRFLEQRGHFDGARGVVDFRTWAGHRSLLVGFLHARHRRSRESSVEKRKEESGNYDVAEVSLRG